MVYLIVASLIWSFSFGLIKTQLTGLPPAWLAMVRLAVAAAVFLPFARRVAWRGGAALVAVGAVQFGLMSLAYMWSFRYLEAYEVALFTVMTPVYVTVLHDLCQRRFDGRNLAAAGLAVLAAAVILWRGRPSGAPLVGFLLVEASNLCFAAGQLAYRRLLERGTLENLADRHIFFWLYLGGFAAMAIPGLWETRGTLPPLTARQIGALAYLGVVVSGISYFCWNSGARCVPAGLLAVMNNLKIPLGVAVSLFVFKENVNLAGLLAGCALFAVAFAPMLRKRSS